MQPDTESLNQTDLRGRAERIVRFHVGQFANLAQQLDEMPEGEGTVLDNCCVL